LRHPDITSRDSARVKQLTSKHFRRGGSDMRWRRVLLERIVVHANLEAGAGSMAEAGAGRTEDPGDQYMPFSEVEDSRGPTWYGM
jgi:hypothetical protein